MKPALLLHIPHSSLTIPNSVREKLCISDAELELELLRMTDRYTDILFDLSTIGTHSIVYPVSRLVVDPERFEDAYERLSLQQKRQSPYSFSISFFC